MCGYVKSHELKHRAILPHVFITQSHYNHELYNYRMVKTAKRLNAILDYTRKMKSSILMVLGLVS